MVTPTQNPRSVRSHSTTITRSNTMKKFIAMWDNTGLECILDVTKHEKEVDMWEKRKAWNILKGDKLVEPKPTLPLNQMIIRARANNQRHYEIYFFNSSEGESLYVTCLRMIRKLL